MPTADKSLKPTGVGWMVAIYIAYCTAVVCNGDPFYTCHAPSDYGPENKVFCNVSYTDTLVLECPDPASQKAAFWRKAVDESAICNAEGPKCNLNPNRNLTNQDSGLYFCEIPAANGSDPSRSYVDITALAPPSLRNVAYCDWDNASVCTRQSILATIWEKFTVTVDFGGIGPFSVRWKHNDSDFDCQEHFYCRERNSTNEMSLNFVTPNPDNATGKYSAIVTNPYGWNVSVTSVDLTHCAPDFDPVSLSSNSSIPLMDGGNTTLSCKLKADSKNWLTVCYGKYNQSFSDFTDESINDKYCTFCFPNSQGKCNLLPPRPEWEVYRTEGGECRDILENDIMIKDFSKNDEGIIVCFYGDDIDPYNLYTTYMLTYMTKTSKSLTVYIIAGAVAILVFVLLFIILAVVYWYRRRRPEPPSITLHDPLSPPDSDAQRTQQQSRSQRRSQQQRRNRHRSQQQGRSQTITRNYGVNVSTRLLDQVGTQGSYGGFVSSSMPESDIPASSMPESDVSDLSEDEECVHVNV